MTDPSILAFEALQRAIVERLKGDASVAALVKDRVYDQVPRSPVKPYLDLGIARLERDRGFGCGKSFDVTLRLYVVSDEFGRKEAWRALLAAEQALDEFEPQILPHRANQLAVGAMQDSADPTRPIEAHLTLSTSLSIAD